MIELCACHKYNRVKEHEQQKKQLLLLHMKIYYIKVSIQLISVSASLKIITMGCRMGYSSLMG